MINRKLLMKVSRAAVPMALAVALTPPFACNINLGQSGGAGGAGSSTQISAATTTGSGTGAAVKCGATTCSGVKPLCCDFYGGGPECVPNESACCGDGCGGFKQNSLYECDDPSDCSSKLCCRGVAGAGTFCETDPMTLKMDSCQAFGMPWIDGRVCSKDSDCPVSHLCSGSFGNYKHCEF